MWYMCCPSFLLDDPHYWDNFACGPRSLPWEKPALTFVVKAEQIQGKSTGLQE